MLKKVTRRESQYGMKTLEDLVKKANLGAEDKHKKGLQGLECRFVMGVYLIVKR